jgi:peroxiredoxin
MRRHVKKVLSFAFVLAIGLATTQAGENVSPAEASRVGRKIDNFTLRDQRGKVCSLEDFQDKKLVVVAFLGTECPLAVLYGTRLESLAKKFASQGVQFLAINSNSQDSLSEVAAYARLHSITFPILKDPDNAVADHFAAIRTPEVFLLDEQREVKYWGRIDDQYAISVQLDKPRRHDLRIAIEELLADKPVSQSVTEAVGCHIGRISKVLPHGNVTYNHQIKIILHKHCVSCHREGQIAPFPLTDFDEVVGWAAMIEEVVDNGRMPPWFADPRQGNFKNDASLTKVEKELISTWIENGCPEGEPYEKSELPPIRTEWNIPEPDLVLYMADQPYEVPADGEVEYQYFVVDPGFKEDKYIQSVEVRPGNRSVVHHALVSITRPGEGIESLGNCGVLINYAPGMHPTHLDKGMGIHVPAGSKFLFQMHYTPNGTPQQDRTALGILFAAKNTVNHEVVGGAIVNPEIEIPAGKRSHAETAEVKFDEDVILLSLSPHMHLRGKAFSYEAIYPDGSKEILLSVPKYDFNWQLRYLLSEPKLLPQDTRIRCHATYDNSEDNLANPDPTATVRWGDQTWNEMLIGFYSVVRDKVE